MGLFSVCGFDTLPHVIASLINLLTMAIFFRAILSWIRPDPYNPIVRALNAITDPILDPLRRIIPRMGMMDISPLVAIIVLAILGGFVCGL